MKVRHAVPLLAIATVKAQPIRVHTATATATDHTIGLAGTATHGTFGTIAVSDYAAMMPEWRGSVSSVASDWPVIMEYSGSASNTGTGRAVPVYHDVWHTAESGEFGGTWAAPVSSFAADTNHHVDTQYNDYVSAPSNAFDVLHASALSTSSNAFGGATQTRSGSGGGSGGGSGSYGGSYVGDVSYGGTYGGSYVGDVSNGGSYGGSYVGGGSGGFTSSSTPYLGPYQAEGYYYPANPIDNTQYSICECEGCLWNGQCRTTADHSASEQKCATNGGQWCSSGWSTTAYDPGQTAWHGGDPWQEGYAWNANNIATHDVGVVERQCSQRNYPCELWHDQSPVCSNGVTYRSRCEAKCNGVVGYSSLKAGVCGQRPGTYVAQTEVFTSPGDARVWQTGWADGGLFGPFPNPQSPASGTYSNWFSGGYYAPRAPYDLAEGPFW